MSTTKAARLAADLTGLNKTVYEATPIEEAWTLKQVMAELVRQGKNNDFRCVEGALKTLAERGVIKMTSDGRFMRYAPTKVHLIQKSADEHETATRGPARASEPEPVKAPATASVPTEAAPSKDPLEYLAQIANAARKLAAELNALAEEVEAAAILAEMRLESVRAESGKLRQLKELLGSIV